MDSSDGRWTPPWNGRHLLMFPTTYKHCDFICIPQADTRHKCTHVYGSSHYKHLILKPLKRGGGTSPLSEHFFPGPEVDYLLEVRPYIFFSFGRKDET